MFQDSSTAPSVTINDSSKKEEIFDDTHETSFSCSESREGTESTIEENDSVQGGAYCLKGTRVTMPGILEALRRGETIEKIIKTLKKHFGVNVSQKELEQAISEFRIRISSFDE